jgi:hypothetical protein
MLNEFLQGHYLRAILILGNGHQTLDVRMMFFVAI